MRLIAWLLTIAFGLSGIALREQGGVPFAWQFGNGALLLAALCCPLFWRRDGGLFGWAGVRVKDRIMLALALLLATPLFILP